jgi:hypothetical protein
MFSSNSLIVSSSNRKSSANAQKKTHDSRAFEDSKENAFLPFSNSSNNTGINNKHGPDLLKLVNEYAPLSGQEYIAASSKDKVGCTRFTSVK